MRCWVAVVGRMRATGWPGIQAGLGKNRGRGLPAVGEDHVIAVVLVRVVLVPVLGRDRREWGRAGKLQVGVLDRGMAWLDTGTHASLMQASQFVQVIEERQGLKIGCLEEIAWRMGFIDDAQLESLAQPLLKSGYGTYLMNILKRGL